jgi:hypothetical protein
MPPKIPGSSYSSKPVRRLGLPKIGATKTKSLFEEYFYALLGILFVVIEILGKAGGLSGFNALVVGAWVTAFIWFANQLKGYLGEKSKAADGKTPGPQADARAEAPKGPLPLSPRMKPMIGPQWPAQAGPRPPRPRLVRKSRVQAPPATPAVPDTHSSHGVPDVPAGQTPARPPEPKKRGFVYERPTLPDRKPKLPHNWPKPDTKKPKR